MDAHLFWTDGRKMTFYRATQFNIGWAQAQVEQLDQLVQRDHTYQATKDDRERIMEEKKIRMDVLKKVKCTSS